MGKSRVLTLIEKVNIIREYLRTQQTTGLAKMFNCHRGQVHHILKHKDEYLADWLATKDPTRTRRPRCKVLNALGLILFEWILRCSHYEFTLTDEMVKSTASEIAKILQYRLFKPNPKWYSRFKIKYKLDGLTSWDDWHSQVGVNQQSLDLTEILNDLRAIHGESVIPNYVQLDDDEFKDLTVRCYGNSNVAQELGKLICNGNADDDMDVASTEPVDTFGESSNSHSGYVSYNGSDSDEQYATISIDNDDSNDAVDNSVSQSHIEQVVEREAKPIQSYREALNALGPLEQFALLKEDVRAVGLINQLEILFQDKMKDDPQ